jgi:hypothetical protein
VGAWAAVGGGTTCAWATVSGGTARHVSSAAAARAIVGCVVGGTRRSPVRSVGPDPDVVILELEPHASLEAQCLDVRTW